MELHPTPEKSVKTDPAGDSALKSDRQKEKPLTEAISDVGTHVAEIRESLGQFFQVKADAVRGKLRHAAFVMMLTMVMLVVVTSFLAMVVVLLISGIAGGVTELVGGRVWLGNSITALGMSGAAALIVYVKLARMKAARLRELVEKYERRKMRQRDRLRRKGTEPSTV